ncbi:MAG: 50S ribosomal protein L25 [Actinobacteria bacterium]|nr:50S ribosomal protein L25 [Actinomycetota bacterium]
MTEYSLNASIRSNMAKSYRKYLFSRGMVPAVAYGKTLGSMPLEIAGKELEKAVQSGRNTIINLVVSGSGGPYKVMVRDLQYDPIKRGIVHADFQQISLKERINTSVDVAISGEAAGGLARLVLRSLEVSCFPAGIPDQITVDVSGMMPGDSIAVRDLNVPPEVRVLSDPDAAVVAVMSPGAGAVGEETGTDAGDNAGNGIEKAPDNNGR